MKKLVSAQTVKQAFKDGIRELEGPGKSVMYTPEALTVAKELGIRLTASSPIQNARSCASSGGSKLEVNEALVRTVVEKVIDRLPPEKRQLQVIQTVVADVLAEYVR